MGHSGWGKEACREACDGIKTSGTLKTPEFRPHTYWPLTFPPSHPRIPPHTQTHAHAQVLKLQQQLEEKDREVRAAVLTAKQATKKAEEATAAAKKQAATTNKAVQDAVAATLAKHKAEVDKKVHLMLCIIKDPAPASSKQPQVSSSGELGASSCCRGGVLGFLTYLLQLVCIDTPHPSTATNPIGVAPCVLTRRCVAGCRRHTSRCWPRRSRRRSCSSRALPSVPAPAALLLRRRW